MQRVADRFLFRAWSPSPFRHACNVVREGISLSRQRLGVEDFLHTPSQIRWACMPQKSSPHLFGGRTAQGRRVGGGLNALPLANSLVERLGLRCPEHSMRQTPLLRHLAARREDTGRKATHGAQLRGGPAAPARTRSCKDLRTKDTQDPHQADGAKYHRIPGGMIHRRHGLRIDRCWSCGGGRTNVPRRRRARTEESTAEQEQQLPTGTTVD